MKGYVQIYTGNGKGKTTAAAGLALRALGAGLKVFVGQFLKEKASAEIRALASLGAVTRQYGAGFIIRREPTAEEKRRAVEGFAECLEAATTGFYDVVILDEIFAAVRHGLVAESEVIRLASGRTEGTELVLTGRDAPPSLVESADLVTEMRLLKHYHEKGVDAREGIEF